MLEKFTRAVLYIFALLLPVFFLPFTPEWLEFSKQYLLYFAVTLGVVAWIIKAIVERRIALRRTPFDIPFLIFWLAVLVSSIFSKDRAMSFFGTYDRLVFGFVPLTFYIALFYLVVHHFTESAQVKKLLTMLGVGIGLSSLYFWIKTLGGLQYPAFLPQWNTVSGTNGHFALLLLVAVLLAFVFLLSKNTKRLETILWTVIGVVSFLTILIMGYKVVFIAGAVGLGIVLTFLLSDLQSARVPVASAGLSVFLIFLILAIFGGLGFITVRGLPAEVSLAHGTSWNVATRTLGESFPRALFGSGPSTFAYDFSAHRPEAINQNIFWSLRFGTPSSEAAGIVTTLGVLGAIVLVFFLISELWLLKSLRGRAGLGSAGVTLFRGVLAAWFAIFALLFFTPFGTVLWTLFFLLLAASTVLSGQARATARETVFSLEGSPQKALSSSFVSIVGMAVFLVLAIYLGRFYAAEAHLSSGILASQRQDLPGAIGEISSALRLNSGQVRYYLILTQLHFGRALREAQKPEPDRNVVAQSVTLAVQSARRATELGPNSAAAWEQLAGIYAQVIGVTQEARDWAIDALGRAIALEPTNPALYVMRGQLYQAAEKLEEAKRDIEKALALKSNYALAFSAQAMLFEAQKDWDKAVESAQRAFALSGNDINFGYQLARAYFNRGASDDLKNAETLLTQIIAQNADHANAHFTLGLLYERQGKTAEALSEFRKVQELNPGNVEVEKKIQGLVGVPPETVVPETP